MLFGVMLVVLASSCINISTSASVRKGNGKEVSGTFSVSENYSSLEVSHGITVRLVPAGSQGAGTFTCDELALDYISITEKNGAVEVAYKPNATVVLSDVKTVVLMPLSASLASLEAVAAGRIESDETLQGSVITMDCSAAAVIALSVEAEEKVTMDLSGAAGFKGNVTTDKLTIEASGASGFKGTVTANWMYVDVNGASYCNIEGTADECTAEASGASSFKGYDLVCRRATVTASGASSIRVTATEHLSAEASGASSVRYKGSPTVGMNDASGASTIKAAE